MSKKIGLNLIANIISFFISLFISFFLSPYIVETVGSDAYGFISLANNFVGYVSMATIALNSMAGNFVTIKFHENDFEQVNKYFSSVVIANIIMSLALVVPIVSLIIFLNKLINVPMHLLLDVQILFALIFINFLISLSTSIFSVSVFIKNKLYLTSLRTIESNIIRFLFTILLFAFLPAKIYYVSIAVLISAVYSTLWNVYYTKKLTPEFEISKKHFDFKAIFELISSGIWNLVTRLGVVLLEGVDLLVCNLFISASAMGTLAIAKTVPNIIASFIFTISGVFAPNLTMYYAKKQFNELKITLKQSIKLLGLFSNIPLMILFVYGDAFFQLWMPTQDSKELQILSILTVMGYVINGSLVAVYSGFTIANKLKLQAFVVVLSGVLSALVVVVLLKTTSLGIYAIAGVSSVFVIIRDMAFGLPMATKHLKLKWYTFYPTILLNVFTFVIITAGAFLMKNLFVINNWLMLIIACGLSTIFCFGINFFIIFSKEEKRNIFSKIKITSFNK